MLGVPRMRLQLQMIVCISSLTPYTQTNVYIYRSTEYGQIHTPQLNLDLVSATLSTFFYCNTAEEKKLFDKYMVRFRPSLCYVVL